MGFLIPCNMKVRALYVNPVTTPTIELASSRGEDQTVYQGQTYTMYNILYQMSYKLPDGYKLLDAGIRMGDNAGISYYFEQTQRYSYDAEAKGVAAGIGAGVAAVGVVGNVFLGGGFDVFGFAKDYGKAMFDKAEEVVYLEREENVMVQEKMAPATLAKKMYESIPINVKKYDPIYWEANAPTKGLFGSIATMPPLRFAQKNNQDHYIYGIAYMRYETPDKQVKTLYTDAIAATVNNPNQSTVKMEQAPGARLTANMPAASLAGSRKAPKREPEQQPEQIDMSTIAAPQTQLTVYADGQYCAQLSDAYGYNETVTVKAPTVDGKTFSYWTTDDGEVLTSNAELTLTMKANTKLRAIYGALTTPAASAADITSITRSNDGQSIVLQAIATGTFTEAGIVYSTTAAVPEINADGVTSVAAVSYSSLPTDGGNQNFYSVLDKNNCWSAQITPAENDANAIYHVRAYTKKGSNVSYSNVRDVKLSTLKSGLMMIANIEAFDHEADPTLSDLLTQLKDAGLMPAGISVTVPAGEYVTFYNDKAMTLSEATAADAKLYTITSVSGNTATATEIPSANAEMPFLVYNPSETEAKTVLLVPTDDQINQVAAPEFVGTLEDTQIAASTEALANYAFNGLQFVCVRSAISIAANRAWLAVPTSTARSINIVFGEATGISHESHAAHESHDTLYDLSGRKIAHGTSLRKGVYIKSGKKVVR